MLQGKKIVLGVCGSIAAYKSATIVRLLKKESADVKVVMTSSACSFITPLTLSTLSDNTVFCDFENEQHDWNNYVDLGLWADLFIIAPASADTIAKMAHGICDNILLTTYLSSKCPVLVAPAMDLDMWRHPATQNNIAILKKFGNKIIPVETGELASGLVGEGRMAEPETILQHIHQFFKTDSKKKLQNKTVLITAGPTIEPIDAVRYLSNFSSGKMGIALAEHCAEQGAKVILVKGPTQSTVNNNNISIVHVSSSDEMLVACNKYSPKSDIIIMAAAVADFKPKISLAKKIKKENSISVLNLIPTTDILSNLGKQKKKNQILVGFALETDNEIENAKKKLVNKNLDLVVLNTLNDIGAGFQHDTNKISIINKLKKIKTFELKSKNEVAKDIINEIVAIF